MASAKRLTTAGRLLVLLGEQEGDGMLDTLAKAAGTTPEELQACRTGGARLTPRCQIALADSLLASEIAPPVARLAHILRGQATAALAYEQQDTVCHRIYPRC